VQIQKAYDVCFLYRQSHALVERQVVWVLVLHEFVIVLVRPSHVQSVGMPKCPRVFTEVTILRRLMDHPTHESLQNIRISLPEMCPGTNIGFHVSSCGLDLDKLTKKSNADQKSFFEKKKGNVFGIQPVLVGAGRLVWHRSQHSNPTAL
jgi:hypothetical protein